MASQTHVELDALIENETRNLLPLVAEFCRRERRVCLLNDWLDILAAFGTSRQWLLILKRYCRTPFARRFYFAYLRSAAWAAKRRAAFKAANYACQGCMFPVGDTEATVTARRIAKEIHHLTYERFGDELPGDLQALCSECHRERHGKILTAQRP